MALNTTGSPAPDLDEPQFNPLPRHNRTQAVLINGVGIPLAGALPYEQFKLIIDRELQQG
jgi:hypothetical protein